MKNLDAGKSNDRNKFMNYYSESYIIFSVRHFAFSIFDNVWSSNDLLSVNTNTLASSLTLLALLKIKRSYNKFEDVRLLLFRRFELES
jgi:hypothetical protein